MALNTGWVGNGRNRTFYEMHIPEDENTNYTPLILLSGGPGLSYKTLMPLFSLAEHVPVLSYDQIGSGKAIKSDKLTSLNIEMYINQFEEIIDKLDIEEFHLLNILHTTLMLKRETEIY